ncbi:MAG: phage baseplate assembly protein [Myxococcota bacterium]
MSGIRVTIDGQTLSRVTRAMVRCDLLELADSWEVAIDPVTERVRFLVREDAEVSISVEGTTVIRGFVEDIETSASRADRAMVIRGRDRAGRLVDEAMPLGKLRGLDLVQLGQRVAGPWFSRVILSNARNRQLVRGLGRKVAAGAEPIFSRVADAQLRVEPGQTRADVLRHFIDPARLLAWSSADGRSLILGRPNRRQMPQYLLDRRRVLSSNRRQSAAERGARYTAYSTRRKTATQTDPRGTFQRDKHIAITASAAANRRQLRHQLAAEVARRTAEADALEITAIGFTQRYSPTDRPTLFAPDTVARIVLPVVGIDFDYLITAVTYRLAGRTAETDLSLTPVDMEIL